MPETLEQRVDELEKKVAALARDGGDALANQGILANVGTLVDDEIAREADRLGREYRQSLRKLDECVDPDF